MAKDEFVWRPYGPYLNTRVKRFMDRYGIATWEELICRSVKDIEWFWDAALRDLGVEWFRPYHRVYDASLGMPWTQWFIGGQLNIVHNCLDRHIRDGRSGRIALYFEEDDGSSRRLTYGQLHRMVKELSRAMSLSGIRKGDRIALCMPISPAAVAIMFAVMKIGAVCMQPAARFAPEEIVRCLNQAEAKLLFMTDGYVRGGKIFSLERTYEAVVRHVPTVEEIVVLSRIGSSLEGREKGISWQAFLRRNTPKHLLKTESMDSGDAALILYSSGTTGRSKTIVHTHGGALAQIVKEIGYAFDCQEDDLFYWFTNIGWMMAPWEIIGALFFGASVVLYGGTYLYPTPQRIFELIEKYRITIFGFTPTALRQLRDTNEDFSRHDLSTLRILGSTGEPLDSETWRWYFMTFGRGLCPIMNISGGTELIGCLLSPLPIIPQKSGSLCGPGLGMDVDVMNEDRQSLRGSSGYLVCRQPFPSMTRGFLGESDLYLETCFPWGPDLWVHGDIAEIDEDGFWFLRGRADDVIVRGGVKHDPAKIEEAVMKFPGPPLIREAAAVGVSDAAMGQRIVCFVVMSGEAPGPLRKELRDALRRHFRNSYHDPLALLDEVYAVSNLPKNLAAKIPHKLLRNAYEGKEIGDLSKLDNPQTLEEIQRLGREHS